MAAERSSRVAGRFMAFLLGCGPGRKDVSATSSTPSPRACPRFGTKRHASFQPLHCDHMTSRFAACLAIVTIMSSTAAAAPPTLEETRKLMGIPSAGDVRGQLDTVGYASTPEGMAKVWELSAQGPMPESLGGKAAPGVVGVIGPHDDYIYAARVYREVFPLVTAKTVVVVGGFHRYRKYEARDQLVFDTYRAWRSPDGEIPVSALRDELMAQLPAGMAVKDAAAHDSEH